jgi:aerobic carbon-monoxide dehydrogenase small subunit
MKEEKISFRLNGEEIHVKVRPNIVLVDLLRETLGLTGTKVGCREGECGVCTVLLDGDPVNACILPVMKVKDREITTIEGLARNGQLHPIQEAFLSEGAVQCGFCTSGMVLAAKALLAGNPCPTDGQIRQALSGILCRCTGYQKIVQAVRRASHQMKDPE